MRFTPAPLYATANISRLFMTKIFMILLGFSIHLFVDYFVKTGVYFCSGHTFSSSNDIHVCVCVEVVIHIKLL